MNVRVLQGTYTLCRLGGESPLPDWFALEPPLAVAIRREDELSLVVADERVPAETDAQRGYRALELVGPLDLDLTGIMASLSGVLADAGIPILPLATHDTDVILVRGERLDAATAALRLAGHTVEP